MLPPGHSLVSFYHINVFCWQFLYFVPFTSLFSLSWVSFLGFEHAIILLRPLSIVMRARGQSPSNSPFRNIIYNQQSDYACKPRGWISRCETMVCITCSLNDMYHGLTIVKTSLSNPASLEASVTTRYKTVLLISTVYSPIATRHITTSRVLSATVSKSALSLGATTISAGNISYIWTYPGSIVGVSSSSRSSTTLFLPSTMSTSYGISTTTIRSTSWVTVTTTVTPTSSTAAAAVSTTSATLSRSPSSFPATISSLISASTTSSATVSSLTSTSATSSPVSSTSFFLVSAIPTQPSYHEPITSTPQDFSQLIGREASSNRRAGIIAGGVTGALAGLAIIVLLALLLLRRRRKRELDQSHDHDKEARDTGLGLFLEKGATQTPVGNNSGGRLMFGGTSRDHETGTPAVPTEVASKTPQLPPLRPLSEMPNIGDGAMRNSPNYWGRPYSQDQHDPNRHPSLLPLPLRVMNPDRSRTDSPKLQDNTGGVTGMTANQIIHKATTAPAHSAQAPQHPKFWPNSLAAAVMAAKRTFSSDSVPRVNKASSSAGPSSNPQMQKRQFDPPPRLLGQSLTMPSSVILGGRYTPHQGSRTSLISKNGNPSVRVIGVDGVDEREREDTRHQRPSPPSSRTRSSSLSHSSSANIVVHACSSDDPFSDSHHDERSPSLSPSPSVIPLPLRPRSIPRRPLPGPVQTSRVSPHAHIQPHPRMPCTYSTETLIPTITTVNTKHQSMIARLSQTDKPDPENSSGSRSEHTTISSSPLSPPTPTAPSQTQHPNTVGTSNPISKTPFQDNGYTNRASQAEYPTPTSRQSAFSLRHSQPTSRQSALSWRHSQPTTLDLASPPSSPPLPLPSPSSSSPSSSSSTASSRRSTPCPSPYLSPAQRIDHSPRTTSSDSLPRFLRPSNGSGGGAGAGAGASSISVASQRSGPFDLATESLRGSVADTAGRGDGRVDGYGGGRGGYEREREQTPNWRICVYEGT